MILCPSVVFFICMRQFLDDVINGMAYYEKKLKGEKSAISASHQKKAVRTPEGVQTAVSYLHLNNHAAIRLLSLFFITRSPEPCR